jgi:hypothetical protein
MERHNRYRILITLLLVCVCTFLFGQQEWLLVSPCGGQAVNNFVNSEYSIGDIVIDNSDITKQNLFFYGYNQGNTIALSYIWNGTDIWNKIVNWTPASVPVTGSNIIIASGELTIDQNVTIANLIIYPDSKLTINSSKTVTITGNLNLKSGATIVDNGSLIINGTTKVEQYLSGSNNGNPNGRFWYVSSPVTGATSNSFDAAGINKVWYYNEPTHAYNEITDNTTTLTVGTGYVARLSTNDTVTFSGTLNTGNQTFYPTRTGTENEKRGFNLVGNPYPSYLDWSAANKSNVLPTVWYRSMNSSNIMVFDTYNASLGAGISASGNPISQYISPLQGFWVKINGDGNSGIIGFTNAMRSHQQNGSLKSGETNDLIRLQVSNEINSDETIIAFNTSASNGFDSFDSPKMSNNNNEIPELYTIADSEHVAINGLKSIATNEIIPLGFKTAKKGTFTIYANEIEGLNGVPVLLEDKLLNKIQDLTKTPSYVFNSDSSDNVSRFVIHLKSSETTSIKIEQSDITIYTKEHSLFISTSIDNNEGMIMVYDVLGREVITTTLSGIQTILDLPLNAGAYFVKVQTNKSLVTKNIVVQ